MTRDDGVRTARQSGSLFDARDWHAIEDLLNKASEGASEPFYSEVEAAKEALMRLALAAEDHAPHREPFDYRNLRTWVDG